MKTAALLALLLTLLVLIAPSGAASSRILPVERQIAACGIEVGIGFDKHGRERWRVAGDEWSVMSTGQQDNEIVNGTFTHNHMDYCSLTPEDVDYCASIGAECRAVFIRQKRLGVAIIHHAHTVWDLPPGAIEAENRKHFQRDDCSEWDKTWRGLMAKYGREYVDYEVIR